MHFTKLVPSVFYKDLSDGKDGISIIVFPNEQLLKIPYREG